MRRVLIDGRLREQLRAVLPIKVLAVACLAAVAWRSRSPDRLDASVARGLYAEPGSLLRAMTDVVTLSGQPVVVGVLSFTVAVWVWQRTRARLLVVLPISTAV